MTTRAQRERGPGSDFWQEQFAAGMALRYDTPPPIVEPLPEPMPGRTADGTRVWLHYTPIRWERHA